MRLWLFIVVCLLVCVGAHAQSDDPYAFMRNSGTGYAEVIPGYRMQFPRDHGAHPEFRIEWWYVTANLQDAAGNHYGVQWTLFRQSLSPDTKTDGWRSNQVWLAHTAITDGNEHRHWQKMSRGGIGQAGVSAEPFRAWIDDWVLRSETAAFYPLKLTFKTTEQTQNYGASLELTADTPEVLNGDQGYSRKAAGKQASYYYSQPHLQVKGEIEWQGKSIPVTGLAWLDREWSSQPLAPSQSGWDWFALHLDDGRALMVYQLREDLLGKSEFWVSGSLVDAGGGKTALTKEDVVILPLDKTTVAGREVPVRWRIRVPMADIDLEIQALHDEQFIGGALPYWEGVIFAHDMETGEKTGTGYMELMGY